MSESVWDYPRPPRLEPSSRRIRVVLDGEAIADTTAALRVLETSHPPVYYLPSGERRGRGARPPRAPRAPSASGRGWPATWTCSAPGGRILQAAAWTYPEPSEPFRDLLGTVAFYPALMDECTVDGERVQPQPGDFYGGWITSEITGPVQGACREPVAGRPQRI